LLRDSSEWVAHIHQIRDQHIRKQQYNRPDTDMFMPHDVFDTLTRIVKGQRCANRGELSRILRGLDGLPTLWIAA